MAKRAFLVHSWHGTPEKHWFPWLRLELEKQGFQVTVPQMPDPYAIRIDEWVGKLASEVGRPDKDTYFVGHSIGCQTILRYAEALPAGERIGGAVLVAPWMHLLDAAFDTQQEREVAQQWIKTSIAWEKVLAHSNKFVCIFSDNDPYVPMSDSEIFREALGARIIIEKGKGHILESTGARELPSALEAVSGISD